MAPAGLAKRRAAAAQAADTRSTRDQILDAAEQRFAESGFAGVSVREIAGEVGLKNQASLYNYFRSKRALYEAVLARGVAPMIELVAASGQANPGGSLVAGVESGVVSSFLDRMLDYLAERPHLARLIARAALDDSKYLRLTAGRLLRPLYAQGLEVLGGSAEVWQADELPNLAFGLYQLIFGYFANTALLEPIVERDLLSATAVERQRRFLKRAVARLLGAELPTASRSRRTKAMRS